MTESPLKAARPNILKPADEAYFLDNAIRFKAAITVPLVLVGGLRSPGLMERILRAGQADMISLCRPLIREPGLVSVWKQGNRKKADYISCGGCQKNRNEPVRCLLLDDRRHADKA